MQCTKTSELSSHSSPGTSGIITIEYVSQQRLFKTQQRKCMSQCRLQFNTQREQGHNKSSLNSFPPLKSKIFLKTETWGETIMLFPTWITLLKSETGGKRLPAPTRAGLALLALHTNPLNDLLFPTRSGHKNAGLSMTSFSLIPFFFSPASLNPYSASLFHSPACHRTYQPQALSGCRMQEVTPKCTSCHLSSTRNSCPSCPKSAALPADAPRPT